MSSIPEKDPSSTCQPRCGCPDPPKVEHGTGAHLSDLRNLLALLSIGLYAILRIAYVRFYAPFGLSPDDLGLGYVELLAQAAIGAVLLIVVIGTVLSLFGFAVYGLSTLNKRPAISALTSVLVVLSVLLVVGAGLVYGLLGGLVVFLSLIVLWLVGLAVVGAGQTVTNLSLARYDSTRNLVRIGFACATVVAVIIAGRVMISAASRDADRIATDARTTHPSLFGVRLTSWGAEAATLSWTTDKIDARLRPLARRCVMYLGQSNSTVFVYDAAAPHLTYRLPAGAVALRVLPLASRCDVNEREPVVK